MKLIRLLIRLNETMWCWVRYESPLGQLLVAIERALWARRERSTRLLAEQAASVGADIAAARLREVADIEGRRARG